MDGINGEVCPSDDVGWASSGSLFGPSLLFAPKLFSFLRASRIGHADKVVGERGPMTSCARNV